VTNYQWLWIVKFNALVLIHVIMRDRRRRPDEPFNPFAANAPDVARQRRLSRQRAMIGEVQRDIESTASRLTRLTKKSRIRNLKSPHSPEVEVPFDEKLDMQTNEARNKLDSTLRHMQNKVKITREVIDLSDIMDMISELDERLTTDIRDDLLKEVKQEQVNIQGNDPQYNAWLDNEVNRIYRELHIYEYELKKEENNGFLKNFDVTYLDGPHLRALNLVNDYLGKFPANATHIGNGKIFSFREGVRIIIDTRRILKFSLEGSKKIWIYVGPNNDDVCINRSDYSPGPDYIVNLILLSNSGWPSFALENMKGDVGFDIGFKLNKWRSKNFKRVETLVRDHYQSMGELVHSIEVYSQMNVIILGTISKKNIAMLVGKKGTNITPLREKIKSDIGENWEITVQKLE